MSILVIQEDSFTEISEEMNKRVVAAINRTWDAIASDYLELCEDGSCDREEMLEGVMDADRMDQYGSDKEATSYCVWLSRFHKKEWQELCKKSFSTTYGY